MCCSWDHVLRRSEPTERRKITAEESFVNWKGTLRITNCTTCLHPWCGILLERGTRTKECDCNMLILHVLYAVMSNLPASPVSGPAIVRCCSSGVWLTPMTDGLTLLWRTRPNEPAALFLGFVTDLCKPFSWAGQLGFVSVRWASFLMNIFLACTWLWWCGSTVEKHVRARQKADFKHGHAKCGLLEPLRTRVTVNSIFNTIQTLTHLPFASSQLHTKVCSKLCQHWSCTVVNNSINCFCIKMSRALADCFYVWGNCGLWVFVSRD